MTSETKSEQITFKVTPTILEKLKQKSEKLGGVGVSNVIRIAMTKYLEEEED